MYTRYHRRYIKVNILRNMVNVYTHGDTHTYTRTHTQKGLWEVFKSSCSKCFKESPISRFFWYKGVLFLVSTYTKMKNYSQKHSHLHKCTLTKQTLRRRLGPRFFRLMFSFPSFVVVLLVPPKGRNVSFFQSKVYISDLCITSIYMFVVLSIY